MDQSKAKTAREEYKPLTIPIVDANMRLQVARYAEWLKTQAMHNSTVGITQETKDYIESAGKTVLIGKRKIDVFAPFRPKHSAFRTITIGQTAFLGGIVLAWVLGVLFLQQATLIATLAAITELYLVLILVNVVLSFSTFRHSSEEQIDDAIIHLLQDADWPTYTILCPLYREARVVPQFVQAMSALSYPTEKLQILLLTEEDDAETRAAIHALSLPPHFKIVTVPEGSPRTKPRACNYGLMQATGQYVVIYDAEDIPEPLQLKKAVLTFANHGPELACVQAKLNFYNPYQNLLTRLFTAEYSLWFDLILPGLQRLRFSIPLGGTSNHFQIQTLRALGGWDAFNVTEDCDLGLRLARYNLQTFMLNSVTYEEANSRLKNWVRQRSRWIKGYMQTYLVNMRRPLRYLSSGSLGEFLSLQLVVGGKTLVLFLNPLLLLLFGIYIFFRPAVGDIYHTLFPKPLLYMGTISLIFGNFFYFYIYLIACVRRKQYRLIKWMVFIPFYWLMMSVAAALALFQLIVKPHYWEKTVHGLHLRANAPPPDEAWQEHSWTVMDRATTQLQAISRLTRPSGAVEERRELSGVGAHETIQQVVETSLVGEEVQSIMMLPTAALPVVGAGAVRSEVEPFVGIRRALKKSRLTSLPEDRSTVHMPAVETRFIAPLSGSPNSFVPHLNGHSGGPQAPLYGNYVHDDFVQEEPTASMHAASLNGHAKLQDDYLDAASVKDHRSLTSSVTASLRAVITLPMPAFSRSERAKLSSSKHTSARDPWLYVTLVIACIASIVACWYSFQQQDILLYSDAYSHLRVARSVLDGSGLSIAQLGGVWLPLPHLLMLPFIWNDYLWQTGLAGSIPSMLCYLISALYLYLAARALTQDGRASCIGALVFILNPNILYLQTTPLSDLVWLATLTIASYYFIKWAQDDQPKQLILAAASTFLATLASYNGWALFLVLFALILVIGLIRRQSRMSIEGNLIIFGVFGGLGIGLWLLWNTVIFGNPLYFLHVSSSSQAYQTALLQAHKLATYHDLWQSLRYYTLDTLDIMGPILCILAALSILVFVARRRPIAETLAALAFLVPFVFYIVSLYTGQAILFIPEAVSATAPQHLYNARFGAAMVAPAALFIATLICRGYIATSIRRRDSATKSLRRPPARLQESARLPRPTFLARVWGILAQSIAVIAIIAQTTLLASNGIIALQDGQHGASCEPNHIITSYLAQHYDGGKILEDANTATFDEADASVDLKNIVSETSGELWSKALHNPSAYVEWIIVRPKQTLGATPITASVPDLVAQYIDIHSAAFLSQFTLVVQEPTGIELYHLNGLPPLPTRQVPASILTEHNLCGVGGS